MERLKQYALKETDNEIQLWVTEPLGAPGPYTSTSTHCICYVNGRKDDEGRAEMRRIAAALNACEGLTTDALEAGILKDFPKVVKQRAELLEATKALYKESQEMRRKLAVNNLPTSYAQQEALQLACSAIASCQEK